MCRRGIHCARSARWPTRRCRGSGWPWAGHKSFVPKDEDQGGDGGSPSGDFKGQRRSNDTHESKTDGDARLYRKGNAASKLRYMGHTLSDNRHGLIASAMVTQADGYAEREAGTVKVPEVTTKPPAAPRAAMTP